MELIEQFKQVYYLFEDLVEQVRNRMKSLSKMRLQQLYKIQKIYDYILKVA